jgi:lipopolysaccharide export system protein LptA
MPYRIDRRLIAVLVIAWAVIPGVAAQEPAGSDPPAPVELVADRAEVDDAAGVSVYRGDVVLTRGDLEITGAVMRVFANAAGELDHVIVNGSPATYREAVEGGASRRAEAPRMEYFVAGPERLILKQGGRLWQGENTVSGRTVTHYPQQGRSVAEGGTGEDERVTASVNPAAD